MAHKTLTMMIIAYNLLRTLMQQAAHEAEKPVHHMSFKGALDLATSSHETFRIVAHKPRKRRAYTNAFIALCATEILDIRPFRKEPRARKRRPGFFWGLSLRVPKQLRFVENFRRQTELRGERLAEIFLGFDRIPFCPGEPLPNPFTLAIDWHGCTSQLAAQIFKEATHVMVSYPLSRPRVFPEGDGNGAGIQSRCVGYGWAGGIA